jgi:hypothetical protein
MWVNGAWSVIHLHYPVKLHQGYIRGQPWDLSLNQGQSYAGERANDGWDLMCNLLLGDKWCVNKGVEIWLIT